MLKRTLVTIFTIAAIIGQQCSAQNQFSPTLSKLEKSLFGIEYENQTDVQRLNRIEENVYGKSSTSNINKRIEKLTQDLSADLIGHEIKPKADTFEDEDVLSEEPMPKADSSVNYPIVNNMEKEVFKNEFKTTDINQRLSNLEQKIFKKTYSDDLNSRVDRLRQAVLPRQNQNFAANIDEDEYSTTNDMLSQKSILDRNYFGPQDNLLNRFPQRNRNSEDYGSFSDDNANSDIDIPLASLEKKILKKSFPDDITSNRLTRLEVQVFGSQFADDDAQTRLDRVASAYQAKKTSSKYDNNKFSQHMATAMQVGTFLLLILAAIL